MPVKVIGRRQRGMPHRRGERRNSPTTTKPARRERMASHVRVPIANRCIVQAPSPPAAEASLALFFFSRNLSASSWSRVPKIVPGHQSVEDRELVDPLRELDRGRDDPVLAALATQDYNFPGGRIGAQVHQSEASRLTLA